MFCKQIKSGVLIRFGHSDHQVIPNLSFRYISMGMFVMGLGSLGSNSIAFLFWSIFKSIFYNFLLEPRKITYDFSEWAFWSIFLVQNYPIESPPGLFLAPLYYLAIPFCGCLLRLAIRGGRRPGIRSIQFNESVNKNRRKYFT